MTESGFWNIIAQSREGLSGGVDEKTKIQLQNLRLLLSSLSNEELIDFQSMFYRFMMDSMTWNIWGAAWIMKGGASDDACEYFCCWLVTQGETIYKTALENPDSLADLEPVEPNPYDNYDAEEAYNLARHVYEERTGEEMVFPMSSSVGTMGERWTDEDLPEMFPKLTAKFWMSDEEMDAELDEFEQRYPERK